MRWTTEKPTVPGWYWVRYGSISKEAVATYFDFVGGQLAALGSDGDVCYYLNHIRFLEFSSEPIPFPTED